MDESRARRHLSKDFMEAMHTNPKILQARKNGRAQKIRQLHEDLIKSSRKLSDNSYSQSGNQYSQYQQNSYQGQQQQYGDQNQETYADVGSWNGENWEFSGEVPFDLTSRSFKYSGCSAIKSYDENRAYETGNPMVMDTYAVFRLCPSGQCNKYSITGCSKNYGEYAVEMKTFLSYILGFYDERYEDYCNYCEPCDWEYQATAKTALQACYATLEQQGNQQALDAQQQAWQDYYNANNGDMSGWNANNPYGGNMNYNNYNNNGAGGNNNWNANYNNYNYNNNANYDANDGSDYGNRRLYQGYYDEDGQWFDESDNAGQYNNGQYNNGQYNVNNEQANGYGNNNGYGYGNNMNGYWGADGRFYQNGDNAFVQTYQLTQCQDGSWCDQCEFEMEQIFGGCDDYICGDYYTYCSDLYGETKSFDVSEYLECNEYEASDGNTYYIGPHCGSDHYTISLGVFSDENCLDYIGEDISLSKVLGFQYSNSDLFQLPKDCVSCDGAEEYEANLNSGTGRYGDYVSAPKTDVEGVVAVCRALYETSAQCNMNMKNFAQISKYMSAYELDLEKRNCGFIGNIIHGAYDENGEIQLKANSFDFSDWRNPQQYKKLKMPVGQAILLSFSIIAFVAAAAAAVFTHRSLTRTSNPWKLKQLNGDEELQRTESGIALSRSQSASGVPPLI